MRVGVYVDGYNLYYGGRRQCGRSTAGWRWLDIGGLARELVSARQNWAGAQVERVVYCIARVDARTNPSAQADQDVYLKALRAAGSVDWIEYGTYVARTRRALLADAAVVISNDSDLALPVRAARGHVPVGTVNPSNTQTVGDLRGKPEDGVGQHRWRKLTPADYRHNQFAAAVAGFTRPAGW